jgi:hypothetical protein
MNVITKLAWVVVAVAFCLLSASVWTGDISLSEQLFGQGILCVFLFSGLGISQT